MLELLKMVFAINLFAMIFMGVMAIVFGPAIWLIMYGHYAAAFGWSMFVALSILSMPLIFKKR